MEKFSVLPTDEKFINLYEEQKTALFEAFNSLPGQETIKRRFYFLNARKELEEKPLIDFVQLGLKKRMEQTFKAQGIKDEQIAEKILAQARQIKDAELNKLKKREAKEL